MPLTKDEIIKRVTARTLALINVDFPPPQCAIKKAVWDKEVKDIRMKVAEKLKG